MDNMKKTPALFVYTSSKQVENEKDYLQCIKKHVMLRDQFICKSRTLEL